MLLLPLRRSQTSVPNFNCCSVLYCIIIVTPEVQFTYTPPRTQPCECAKYTGLSAHGRCLETGFKRGGQNTHAPPRSLHAGEGGGAFQSHRWHSNIPFSPLYLPNIPSLSFSFYHHFLCVSLASSVSLTFSLSLSSNFFLFSHTLSFFLNTFLFNIIIISLFHITLQCTMYIAQYIVQDCKLYNTLIQDCTMYTVQNNLQDCTMYIVYCTLQYLGLCFIQ